MRPFHDRSGRPGKLLLWAGLALIAVFAGVAVLVYLRGLPRYATDAKLLAELAEVTFDDDPPPGPDWPQWRGTHRNGVAGGDGLLDKWPDAGPKRLWKKPGGDGYSSFALVGDAAYGMVAAGEGQEAVVCWSLADGQERWRHSYDPGARFDYGGPRATPTVAGGRLYTVSSSGVLMCLKTDKGDVVWQRDLRQELDGQAPRWGYAFSPLVEGGLVYAVPGGTKGRALAAFHQASGDLAWATQDSSAGYSSPVAATIGGKRQVLFLTGQKLMGVTPDQGQLLWSFDWQDKFEVNAATPLVVQGRDKNGNPLSYVFISSGYGRGCALLKIEERGGSFTARQVYSNNELCLHFSSPVRYQAHLYGLDETRDLTCLDLKTGQVAWRFDRGGEDASSVRRLVYNKGSILRVNDRLIVYGDNGKLGLVACDPTAYRELSAFRAFRAGAGNHPTWAMPALARGQLVVRDRKEVMCLDLRASKEKP